MNYTAYKMEFPNGVHFGKHTIENSEYTFHADTLFSALCHEATRKYDDGGRRLYELAVNGDIQLSDAFPYCGDDLYIPRPMVKVERERQADSTVKKALKKLVYIPVEQIEAYCRGQLDAEKEQKRLADLGVTVSRSMTAIRGLSESMPYRVGVYQYHAGNGLYIIVGYREDEFCQYVEELLEQLSYSGIGGKRSSGLGRFVLKKCALPQAFIARLTQDGKIYMNLSVSLPREEELEEVLSGADYLLIKRSGFVASDKYADDYYRKKDLYVMDAGACVRQRFQGDVYDVSSGGSHPVYRYAKPMLMEVDL